MKLLKNPYFWLGLILILAAFLRFYRLEEYLQFLGDEGRDVLIVKRMIVDHKWTLLGPSASVGGFFIGPIYYYFMLPFLWLSNLNPVGPAYMAALFGLGLVILVYFFCKKFFDTKTAILAALFVTVSPRLIEISRFSWNPNPMPFFGLLTVYLLYLAYEKNKKLFTFLGGASLGIMLQLHYIDFAFIPLTGFMVLGLFPKKEWLWQLGLLTLGTLAGNSLFLLFEIRHGFPNIQSAWEFVTRRSNPVAPRTFNPFGLFDDVARQMFDGYFGFAGKTSEIIYHLSLIGLGVWGYLNRKKDYKKVLLMAIWLFGGVLGVGFYRGQLYPHYFGYLMALPAIMMAVSLSFFWSRRVYAVFGVAIIGILLWLQIPRWVILSPPNNLLTQTKKVADIVLSLSGGQDYNFALVAPGNSDHGYRYFLELESKQPVTILPPQSDPDRKSVTKQLIVVCEQKDCKVHGNSSWEIAGWGDGEIVSTVDGPAGIKIHKLVK